MPFQSIQALRLIKNNKFSIETKYSKIFIYFKNIIDNNDIEKEEYQYIISFLLKNLNNNFVIFDKIGTNISFNNEKEKGESEEKLEKNLYEKECIIFFEFLSKIKFMKNIINIKFNLSDMDNDVIQKYLENGRNFPFTGFFQNIKHLEINKIENSFNFINKLINFNNNSINNIEKINLNNINLAIKNEELLIYDNFNSLYLPTLNKIIYLFLAKVNLSIFCLNEIINNNPNLKKLVVNRCSNNAISLYNENEYSILINQSLNNCKKIKHIEFNNNNFSDFLTNKIIYNLCKLFFSHDNEIYLISCSYPLNITKSSEEINEEDDLKEILHCLKDHSNSIFSENFNRYLTIKLSPSLSYHIKKNKRIIEISNFLQKEKENILKELNYEKIKLILYSVNNFSISNFIKKAMESYYQKNTTKYFQIFSSNQNAELTPEYNIKHKNNKYSLIEKFTIFFQNEEETISLFGNQIILAIISFFPFIKIISFKNINFQSDTQKFKPHFDEVSECLEMVLFGKKNKDFSLFKNKENCLKEIKFSNCYFSNNLITKDILDEIETKISTFLGKKIIKISFVE